MRSISFLLNPTAHGNAHIGTGIAMATSITPNNPKPFNLALLEAPEDKDVNWLALSDDEVFDLWHSVRDELPDIAERLRIMMFGKPKLVN